jgi:hypothetical protein
MRVTFVLGIGKVFIVVADPGFSSVDWLVAQIEPWAYKTSVGESPIFIVGAGLGSPGGNAPVLARILITPLAEELVIQRYLEPS